MKNISLIFIFALVFCHAKSQNILDSLEAVENQGQKISLCEGGIVIIAQQEPRLNNTTVKQALAQCINTNNITKAMSLQVKFQINCHGEIGNVIMALRRMHNSTHASHEQQLSFINAINEGIARCGTASPAMLDGEAVNTEMMGLIVFDGKKIQFR